MLIVDRLVDSLEHTFDIIGSTTGCVAKIFYRLNIEGGIEDFAHIYSAGTITHFSSRN